MYVGVGVASAAVLAVGVAYGVKKYNEHTAAVEAARPDSNSATFNDRIWPLASNDDTFGVSSKPGFSEVFHKIDGVYVKNQL